MSRYVVSDNAQRDLEDIWDYIAHDNVGAADRWAEKLYGAIELLAHNPGIGHLRADLTDLPLLFWSVGDYLLIYRSIEDGIEMVAITQGSRNIPKLLRGRG